MEDIVVKENVFYNAKTKTFEDTVPVGVSFDIITEPVFVAHAIHPCFSHAIIDSCLPIFWVIDDLLKTGKINNSDVRLFVQERHFDGRTSIFDSAKQSYIGAYNDIVTFLTQHPVYFQHLISTNYVFKTCIFYPHDDRWQRTPWNCVDHYHPARNVLKQNVRFSDDIIYEKLANFRNMVVTKSNVYINENQNNLIIVDRAYNRKIEDNKLQALVQGAAKNTGWNFTGVYVLEGKSLQEQVKLFANNRIFIYRLGSCVANLLWIPENSVVFELIGGKEGVVNYDNVSPRILKLTNSKRIVLHYDSYDCERDIFEKIKSYI